MTAKKPFSEWTDERKEKHIAYDQKKYSVIGCKIPRETADSFRNYCKSQGRTVSSVLAEFIRSKIEGSTEKTD